MANQLLRLQAASATGLAVALYEALLDKSAIYYLGWYATLQLLLEDRSEAAATKSDVAFALAITLFNFLPAYSVPWISVTATGAYILATSGENTRQNASAAVLLALAFNGLWGPKLFDFFAIYLLRADAALVGAALSATQPGMGWDDTIVGTYDGHRVLIFGPCSSFHNISLGLLCWVAISRLVHQVWRWQDLMIGLVVCIAVVLLNGTRLYLMALAPESFGYWHDGFGETIFTWVTTFTILLISLWGIYRTTERRA